MRMLGLGFLQLAAKEKMKKFGVEERLFPFTGTPGISPRFAVIFFV